MALPVAHALAGVACLAAVDALAPRPGLSADLRLVAAFALLGCLPDLDIPAGLLLSGDPVAWHGGPTHSLAFAALIALISLPWWPASRRLTGGLAVFVAVASHVIIDMLSGPQPGLHPSHGTSLLWPWQDERVNTPVTLFRGAWRSAADGWFNARNVATAGIELALFAPLAVVLLVVARRRAPAPVSLLSTRS